MHGYAQDIRRWQPRGPFLATLRTNRAPFTNVRRNKPFKNQQARREHAASAQERHALKSTATRVPRVARKTDVEVRAVTRLMSNDP